MHEKLANVLFVSVPENISNEINGFRVDPSKLLPVETITGETDFSADELTWEMIIAGMLKVLAWESGHEDAEYYRDFIKAVKPDIGDELGTAGIIKAQDKEYEIAEEIFMSLSSLYPEKIDYHLNLAIVYQEQAKNYEKLGKKELADGYFDKAYQIYLDSSENGEDWGEYQYNFGMFYLHAGNYAKAGIHLKKFSELDPENPNCPKIKKILEMITEINSRDEDFLKAYDYIRLGREREGIEHIRKYIEKNNGSWNAWFMLGWALRRIGKYGDALAAFEQSFSLNPHNSDTHNEMAICNMELGEYSKCRENLETALKMEPENTKIISNFGILAIKQNRPEEAESYFRTVIEFEPDDPIAVKYLEYLEKEKK
ncbi:MAG: tetratricopeptide repeat protein [Spirochaetales bacterium]|nr:tetratricopeptide repeat protein [Spirochaetales bacterium]